MNKPAKAAGMMTKMHSNLSLPRASYSSQGFPLKLSLFSNVVPRFLLLHCHKYWVNSLCRSRTTFLAPSMRKARTKEELWKELEAENGIWDSTECQVVRERGLHQKFLGKYFASSTLENMRAMLEHSSSTLFASTRNLKPGNNTERVERGGKKTLFSRWLCQTRGGPLRAWYGQLQKVKIKWNVNMPAQNKTFVEWLPPHPFPPFKNAKAGWTTFSEAPRHSFSIMSPFQRNGSLTQKGIS